MIDITYTKDKSSLKVEIKGHAEYGRYGEDIICSAVSILAYTLAEAVRKLCEEEPFLYHSTIDLKAGNSLIEMTLGDVLTTKPLYTFDVLNRGFSMIEDTYPNNVKYTVVG